AAAGGTTVGGSANRREPGPIPARQRAGLDREQRALVPIREGADATRGAGDELGHILAQPLQAGGVDLLVGPLRDHIADLPLVAAIEEDSEVAAADAAERAGRVVGLAR